MARSMMTVAALAVAVPLCLPPRAVAGIAVCNNSSKGAVNVSVGLHLGSFEKGVLWEGWWMVLQDKCALVRREPIAQTYWNGVGTYNTVYVHARSKRSLWPAPVREEEAYYPSPGRGRGRSYVDPTRSPVAVFVPVSANFLLNDRELASRRDTEQVNYRLLQPAHEDITIYLLEGGGFSIANGLPLGVTEASKAYFRTPRLPRQPLPPSNSSADGGKQNNTGPKSFPVDCICRKDGKIYARSFSLPWVADQHGFKPGDLILIHTAKICVEAACRGGLSLTGSLPLRVETINTNTGDLYKRTVVGKEERR